MITTDMSGMCGHRVSKDGIAGLGRPQDRHVARAMLGNVALALDLPPEYRPVA
jgi:hypothetical protein